MGAFLPRAAGGDAGRPGAGIVHLQLDYTMARGAGWGAVGSWQGLYLLVYAASGQIDVKIVIYLYLFISIDIMAIMKIEILLYSQMMYFSFG